MKIRTGFVSNSSSSSFVAWGVPAEVFVRAYNRENNKKITENDLWELDGGDFSFGGSEYEQFLGITLDTLVKNYPSLKLSEIKKFVLDEMNKHFGLNLDAHDIDYTEQGWYDG